MCRLSYRTHHGNKTHEWARIKMSLHMLPSALAQNNAHRKKYKVRHWVAQIYLVWTRKKTGHNNQLQTQALQNQLHNRNGYKFRLDISLVSSLTELNTVAFKYIDGGDDDDSNPISKHCTEQFVVSTSPMKSIDSAYVNKSKSAENAFDEHAYVIVNSMKLPDCLAMRIDVYFSIRVANDWIQWAIYFIYSDE